MWLSEEGIAFATRRTMKKLEESGQVGYIEKPETVFLPETTITIAVGATDSARYATAPLLADLVVGETYTVIYDGVEYNCVAEQTLMGGKVMSVGKTGMYNGEELDSELPFFGYYVPRMASFQKEKFQLAVMPDGNPHTVSIVPKETIHPIDPKFLPGVCLPVVELSAETMTALYSGSIVMATEKETAAFMAAKEKVSPLVVRGNFNGAGFASVGAFITDSNTGKQAFNIPIGGFVIVAWFGDDGVTLNLSN